MRICQLADSQLMDGGRIVLVGSPVAFAGANKPSYAASKAALHGLTMSVSRQLGKRGICVNTVLPGPMITGMTSDWSDEKRSRIAQETRLNRLAKRRYCPCHGANDGRKMVIYVRIFGRSNLWVNVWTLR